MKSLANLKVEHLWMGIPVLMIIWKGFAFPLPLLDFWWHLKMGEVIVSTGAIPRTDIFSFTAAGQPFIVQNWLAEILLFLVYRLGGLPLLVFFNALLLVAALIPVYGLCHDLAPSARLSALAAFLPAFGLFANLRPQVFSFVLFSIFLWVLFGFRSGRRRKAIWTLPFLMVLWVNLHGAFVVGLALMALFLCSEAVSSWCNRAEEALSPRQIRTLLFVFLACGAATVANPELHNLYRYVHTVITDPSSQQFVIEWQPPRVDAVQGLLLFYLPFFASLLVMIYSDRRPDLTESLLFIAFAAFAMKSSRNTPWFSLAAAPIVARHLFATDWCARLGLERQSRQLSSPRPLFNALIIAISLALLIVSSPWVQPKLYGTRLVDPQTPVGAVDYIAQHKLEGNIFHPQAYGDYLIWRLWPKQHSFFDGRVHLFGQEFVKLYRQIRCETHWEQLLEPYAIRFLLLTKDSSDEEGQRMVDSTRASAHWHILYEDDISILFGRGNQPDARAKHALLPSIQRAMQERTHLVNLRRPSVLALEAVLHKNSRY